MIATPTVERNRCTSTRLKPSPESDLKAEIIVARCQPARGSLFILRDEEQPVR
jgi:hypothetical protein